MQATESARAEFFNCPMRSGARTLRIFNGVRPNFP